MRVQWPVIDRSKARVVVEVTSCSTGVMDARALALQLLDAPRRQEIARGVFRFACRVEPMVAMLPEDVSVGSIAGFIRGLEVFLRTNDQEPFADIVKATVSLRRLGGFDWTAIVTISHCYLPVIRKVFLKHGPDPVAALKAYDLVESAVIPFIARMLSELLRPTSGPGQADAGFATVGKTEEMPERLPFELVSVEES